MYDCDPKTIKFSSKVVTIICQQIITGVDVKVRN